MVCEHCGKPTRIQVQATISAPAELSHNFTKKNLRRRDVYLLGVNWETADIICENPKCRRVVRAYGNYVSRLEKENAQLKAEIAALAEASIGYDPAALDQRWAAQVADCLESCSSCEAPAKTEQAMPQKTSLLERCSLRVSLIAQTLREILEDWRARK